MFLYAWTVTTHIAHNTSSVTTPRQVPLRARNDSGACFQIPRPLSGILTFCWPCISVFNQLDAQNLFHNKFYFMPLHVSSTCAHHQKVKIALHSLWYHHTCRWLSRARDDTRGCVIQFWPPDEEHMCSKHVQARNKTYCETNFVHQVGQILI